MKRNYFVIIKNITVRTYVVIGTKREMYLEMQLVDSRHVSRTALMKFLAVPRVQHYFHNPFRRFLSPDAKVTARFGVNAA